MEHLYQYILDEIKRLLDKKRRHLFLKDSKILNYLSEIEESDIVPLELGNFLAIEAIASAVIEMRNHFSRASRATTTYAEDCKCCDWDVLNL